MSNNNGPSLLDPNLNQWIADQGQGQPQQSDTKPIGVLTPTQQLQDWLAGLAKQAEAYKAYKL